MRCPTHDYEYDFLIGKCPHCERQESDDRREAAEEQRHKERLETDERRFRAAQEFEEDRRQAEEIRQLDSEQRETDRERERENAEAERWERKERHLEWQREQAANAWRYAAESKLKQADALYQGGAYKDALALAMDATALGLDARRLIAWIYRDGADGAKYREQLQVQIGLLGIEDSAPSFADHQARVLTEILSVGKENRALLAAYFDVANRWKRFPYAIHDVLAINGLLALDLYRQLLVRHIDGIAKEPKNRGPALYGERFLALLLSIPTNDELVESYVATSKNWAYFSSGVIAMLLGKQDTKRANEVFTDTAKLVTESQTDDMFVWQVCPMGIELAERGKQPRTWAKKFQSAVEASPLSKVNSSRLKEILESTAMSPKAKALIRATVNAKAKKSVAAERAEKRKELLRDKSVLGRDLGWLHDPRAFALAFATPLAVLLWHQGRVFAAAFAAIGTLWFAVSFKRRSNVRLLAMEQVANWFETRRKVVGTTLHLSDTEAAVAIGAVGRPSRGIHLVQDFSIALVVTLLIAAMFWSPLDNRSQVTQESAEWTRDWAAVLPNMVRQTARLRLEASGTPTLNLHEKTLWWTNSSPLSMARLSQCVASREKVTCSASVSIVGRQFPPAPGRLELDLRRGSGSFLLSPPGERAVPVELFGTPMSLNSDLTWISTDATPSVDTKPTVNAASKNRAAPSRAAEAKTISRAEPAKVRAFDLAMPPVGIWEGKIKTRGRSFLLANRNFEQSDSQTVVMEIRSAQVNTSAGHARYPSLGCSMPITLTQIDNGAFVYRESVGRDSGRCVYPGLISLVANPNGGANWMLTDPANPNRVLATATLLASTQQNPSGAVIGASSDRTQANASITLGAPALESMQQQVTPSAVPTLPTVKDPRSGCSVWKPEISANDTVTWSGRCVNGFADGKGMAQWAANGNATLTYEGTFVAGVLQGRGRMTAAGGDRYDGDYRDGKRDGPGAYTTATGDRYDGEFKDNKRNGHGILTRADGSRFEGMFRDGKLVDGATVRAP